LIYLDRLLTTLFNNNTKKLLDNLSNESSTNSSGFHSKSTTTLFNNEHSPKLDEISDFKFSGKKNLYINKDYGVFFFQGMSPLYTYQYQMNV